MMANKAADRVPNIKFERGPAKLTQKIPDLKFLKFRTSIGTGLAHPIIEKFVKAARSGKKMVPHGS
jgi:hypothetical protein